MFKSILIIAALLVSGLVQAAPPEKDWTILVFLNGNNNLNRYARDNLVDMEHVGSNDRLNVVVQWADFEYHTTRRFQVMKNPAADVDHLLSKQTVDELGRHVDMGDWRTLVDFIRWGVEHYPAKHYFVDVWDHGTGWHDKDISPKDISDDDFTHHWITTLQLGQALEEGARIIGHKIDIYGNDACNMGMVEIAAEVADSAKVFVGSEAEMPVDGWPYKPFLEKWEAQPQLNAAEIAKLLHTEYMAYYNRVHKHDKEATLSVFDLDQMPAMLSTLANFGKSLSTLGGPNLKKARDALRATTGFSVDYIDIEEYLSELSNRKLEGYDASAIAALRDASSKFVIANGATPYYAPHAKGGAAIWISPRRKIYDQYLSLYKKLKFSQATRWEEGILPLAEP